jgi:hypothetical protein
MTVNTALVSISKKIKALEKKSIANVIEIGKLLHQASEQIEHGDYMDWLKSEFGWSHQTAYNYRNVYALSQNSKILNFDKLDISISALYLVAKIMNHDPPDEIAVACATAVIDAAKRKRVSYTMARYIIDKNTPESAPEPSPAVVAPKKTKAKKAILHSATDDDLAAAAAGGEIDIEIDDDAGPVDETRMWSAAVLDMLNLSENHPFWTALIADPYIGPAKLLELSVKLRAIYDAQGKLAEIVSGGPEQDTAPTDTKPTRLH